MPYECQICHGPQYIKTRFVECRRLLRVLQAVLTDSSQVTGSYETGRFQARYEFLPGDITAETRSASGQPGGQYGVPFDHTERERRKMHWASCEMDEWLADGKGK
jgi:hypothetical protein